MSHVRWMILALLILPAGSSSGQGIPKGVRVDGIPPIPEDLVALMSRYNYSGSATNFGWLGAGRRLVVKTYATGSPQVAVIDVPGQPPRPITSGPPVKLAWPRPGSTEVLVGVDKAGDERYQLVLIDATSGRGRPALEGRLSHFSLAWTPRGRWLVAAGVTRESGERDLLRIDPAGEAPTVRLLSMDESFGVAGCSPDEGQVAIVASNRGGRSPLRFVDLETGHVQDRPVPLATDRRASSILSRVRWAPDEKCLYYLSDIGADFQGLRRLDLTSGDAAKLATGISWDVETFETSDDGALIAIVINEDSRAHLRVLDAKKGKERPIPKLAEGQIDRIRFRPGSHELVFDWGNSQTPTGVYSLDLDSGHQDRWFQPQPQGDLAGRADEPEVIRFRSFDGRMIPALVRRPNHRRFPGRRPVLIEFHGGPRSQSRPSYAAMDDLLVNELGIALVRPNLRGSTGYGKEFEALDNRERRVDAIKDVGALLDWVAQQPDLNPYRTAVSGGSYGGYMTLCALARYGDRLRCGIDIVGVANFETFLASRPLANLDYDRDEFGDLKDPKMRETLRTLSPLTWADRIRKPLLVAHGRNDPRVPVGEAGQIVSAVRKNHVPVWSVLAVEEGHGFERAEDTNYLRQAILMFLRQHLLSEGRSVRRTSSPGRASPN